MTGLTDKDRQALSELLPFYLNGTLEPEERARVEAALAGDEELRRDLEFLKMVQAETQARDIAASPGEFGLARLMRDIDAERGQAVATRRGTLVWKLAAAACFALFVATSALLVTGPDSGLRLAGGGSAVAVHEGPLFTVAFVESAPEAQIRALLLSLDLEIVSGPSALGLYTLAAPEGADAGLIAAKLAAATGLVESVEREE
jgi:anti-sigma factor RsiW